MIFILFLTNITSTNNSRKNHGRKIYQIINLQGEKLVHAAEFLSKTEITPLDLRHGNDFSKRHYVTLSVDGRALKIRLILMVAFYKSLSKSEAATKIVNPSGYIPGVDSFLDNFIKHYQSNSKFRDGLVVNLMKGYVAKVDGIQNPKYGSKVLNFFMALVVSGDKKAFEYCSGNIAMCLFVG